MLGVMLAASCRTIGLSRQHSTLATSQFMVSDTSHIQFAVPSADGRRLAILTTTGLLMAWQLEPRRLLGRWQIPGTPIQNHTLGSAPMAFDAIGEYLALGTKDGPVRIWQVDPPQMLGAFNPTPPGTIHAHARGDSSVGAVRTPVVDSTRFGQFAPSAVAFAPGRFQLAVSVGPGLSLWNLKSMMPFDSAEFNDQRSSTRHATVSKIAYSAAGATLLVATEDGLLRRIEERTKRELWQRDWGFSPATALVVSPTGGTVFIAGGLKGLALFARLDGSVQCRVAADNVESAVFSPEGGEMLVANNRGIIVVNVQRCETYRVTVRAPYLAAGAWFDAGCRRAFLASRVSRKIDVFALPSAFWC